MPQYHLKGIHNWTDYKFTFEFGDQPVNTEAEAPPMILSVYRNDELGFEKKSKELPYYELYCITSCDFLDYHVPANVIDIQAGGYCRMQEGEFFFSKPVKVSCIDRDNRPFRNQIFLEIGKTGSANDDDYLIIKHVNGKIIKSIFLNSLPSGENQVIEFYLSISKKDHNKKTRLVNNEQKEKNIYADVADLGFFIEPMAGDLHNAKASLKAIARPLFEMFSGQRNRVIVSTGSTSKFNIKAGNDDVDTKCKPANKDEEPALTKAKALFANNEMKAPELLPLINDLPFGKFKVKCSTPPEKFAENKEEVKFSVYMDDFFQLVNPISSATPATPLLHWEISQPKESRHRIDRETGVFTCVAAEDGSIPECTISVTFEVSLEISWPKDWPKPFAGDDDITWTKDPQGHACLWIIYSILKELPKDARALLYHTKLIRHATQEKRCDFIALTNSLIIPDQLVTDGNPNKIAVEIMKGFAQAMLFNKSPGAAQDYLFKILYGFEVSEIHDPTFLLRDRINNTLLKFVLPITIFLPPIFTFNAIFEFYAQGANSIRDNTREFCEQTGWKMNSFNLRSVPIVGWFLGTFTKETPNYVFAAAGIYDCLRYDLGVYNERSGDKDWTKAGMCGEEALKGPIFDFMLSFLKSACDDDILKGAGLSLNTPDEVRKLFLNKHYFGATWKPLKAAQLKVYSEILFAEDLYTEPVSGLSISSVRSATVENRNYNKLYYSVKNMFDEWNRGAGKAFAKTTETLKKLEAPVRETSMKEFVRTLAIHEGGLELYKPGVTQCTVGDMLISYNEEENQPYPWIAAESDGQNQLLSVTGIVKLDNVFSTEKLVQEPHAFKYIWKVATAKRTWPDNKVEGSYADISATLAALIRLWGETNGKYDLKTTGGFFQEFLTISGLRDETYVFETGIHLQSVFNYCNTHGKGLELYSPEIPLQAGDIVVPFMRNTVGVVIKINEKNQPIHVLWGGTGDRGLLGEPEASVKLQHDFDHHDCYYYWKPTQLTRKYI